MMKFILLICLLLLASSGCSQKKEAKTSIVVSFGALVGTNYSGGALLRAVDSLNNKTIDFELKDPYLATIPFGKWDLYFYGFDGGSPWTGAGECGLAQNVDLSLEQVTVTIIANNSNCSSPEYVSLRGTKDLNLIGKWDDANSKWDLSVWGP